jgi:transcriptional regulator with XRE-family HTH domain
MEPPYAGNRLRQLRGNRYTQEEVAEKLRVDPSTYRRCEDGETRPRPANLRALSAFFGVRDDQLGFGDAATVPAEEPGAELLRVAIAVVTQGPHVLLVCRRNDTGTLSWQFPAGVVKPEMNAEVAAVRETYSETAIHCAVRQRLGARVHPITNAFCEYFLCGYLGGTIENRDIVENVSVSWVERARLTDFIPANTIFPPILKALEADEHDQQSH